MIALEIRFSSVCRTRAGDAGTGKTILSNQLCFNHIANGGRAVYVTLLVETHGRMLAHLGSMSFFDPGAVADTLNYISGSAVMQKEGLDDLLTLLKGVISQYQATMLIVEGVETARAIAESDLAFKQFLQALQSLAEARGCTTFLVAQSLGMDSIPGRAVVDGLVELRDTRVGLRRVRELEVLKFRGSDYLRNSHSFNITAAGITVYPRIEALVGLTPPSLVKPRARIGFGSPRLDEMMRGGPFSGSCTMVLGTPGSGKTQLGLHFLAAGARKGEQGLYFGFDEPPEWLIHKADQVGLKFSELIAEGRVDVEWRTPLDNILDDLAEQLLNQVRTRRVVRLFIDGLSGLERAGTYPDRMFAFFAALVIQLRSLGVTTVFSAEIAQMFGPEVELPAAYASGTTDNILFLRYVELRSHLYRLISILKMRDSAYESAIREFAITEHGIDVEATFESAEAILTGLARPLPPGMDATMARSTSASAPPFTGSVPQPPDPGVSGSQPQVQPQTQPPPGLQLGRDPDPQAEGLAGGNEGTAQ